MHPWSKDCGCPFARVGPISIRSPRRGVPTPSAGGVPAPGSLSPQGVVPHYLSLRGGFAGDETWPQPRVPRGGPEPSRAQLLQGRAASDETLSYLQPQGSHSLKPRDGTPSVQAWSSGAQAGRIQFQLCFAPPSRPVTRPPSLSGRGYRSRQGCPECALAPVRCLKGLVLEVRQRRSLHGGRRTEDAAPSGAPFRNKRPEERPKPGRGMGGLRHSLASTTLPVPTRARLSRYDLA